MVVAFQKSPFTEKQVGKISELRPSGWFGMCPHESPRCLILKDDAKTSVQQTENHEVLIEPSRPEFYSIRPSEWLGCTPCDSFEKSRFNNTKHTVKKALREKNIYVSENYQELGGTRPSEWLGRNSSPSASSIRAKSPEKNITTRYVCVSSPVKQKLTVNPLDEIHGNPVKNSPFLAMQKPIKK
jgi:hypothetical protein